MRATAPAPPLWLVRWLRWAPATLVQLQGIVRLSSTTKEDQSLVSGPGRFCLEMEKIVHILQYLLSPCCILTRKQVRIMPHLCFGASTSWDSCYRGARLWVGGRFPSLAQNLALLQFVADCQ